MKNAFGRDLYFGLSFEYGKLEDLYLKLNLEKDLSSLREIDFFDQDKINLYDYTWKLCPWLALWHWFCWFVQNFLPK